jgi:hypothetical protein
MPASPVEPTDGRGAGGKGRERAPEMADRRLSARPSTFVPYTQPYLSLNCDRSVSRIAWVCPNGPAPANRLNGLLCERQKYHYGRRQKQKGLSVQGASQRLASVVLGLPGHAGIRRTIKAVIRPRIHVQLDRYSGAAQSIRIG